MTGGTSGFWAVPTWCRRLPRAVAGRQSGAGILPAAGVEAVWVPVSCEQDARATLGATAKKQTGTMGRSLSRAIQRVNARIASAVIGIPPFVAALASDVMASASDVEALAPNVIALPPDVNASAPDLAAIPPNVIATPPDVIPSPPAVAVLPLDVNGLVPFDNLAAPNVIAFASDVKAFPPSVNTPAANIAAFPLEVVAIPPVVVAPALNVKGVGYSGTVVAPGSELHRRGINDFRTKMATTALCASVIRPEVNRTEQP